MSRCALVFCQADTTVVLTFPCSPVFHLFLSHVPCCHHHVTSITTSVLLYGASPLSSCHFNINLSLPLWRFPSIIMSLQYQPQSSSMALPLYHHVSSITTSVFLYGASPLSSCHFNINLSLPLWRFPSIIMSLQYQPQSSSMALPLYHHVSSITTSVFLYSPVNLSTKSPNLDKIATETLFVGNDSRTHPEQHIKNIDNGMQAKVA